MKSLRDKIYAALGFRECRAEIPDEFKESGMGSSKVVFDIGMADRLRLLWSGVLMVEITHWIEPMPVRFESPTKACSVLPPGS